MRQCIRGVLYGALVLVLHGVLLPWSPAMTCASDDLHLQTEGSEMPPATGDDGAEPTDGPTGITAENVERVRELLSWLPMDTETVASNRIRVRCWSRM